MSGYHNIPVVEICISGCSIFFFFFFLSLYQRDTTNRISVTNFICFWGKWHKTILYMHAVSTTRPISNYWFIGTHAFVQNEIIYHFFISFFYVFFSLNFRVYFFPFSSPSFIRCLYMNSVFVSFSSFYAFLIEYSIWIACRCFRLSIKFVKNDSSYTVSVSYIYHTCLLGSHNLYGCIMYFIEL